MLPSVTSIGSEPARSDEFPFFVCVHVGAGDYDERTEREQRRLMSHACRCAADTLLRSGDIMDAVTDAIALLEVCHVITHGSAGRTQRAKDSELTNAGHGSNLNFDGEVECDASIMSGNGRFGAIGAAAGVKNPIKAARHLAQLSEEPLPLGRVRPIFLAGDGVRKWALQEGLEAVENRDSAGAMHVTQRSTSSWKHYRDMVSTASTPTETNLRQTSKTMNDTIGCIVVNAAGELCAGVSSGGIALKTPGRVGEAAIHGAGCWAYDAGGRNTGSVACSVSGVGEVVTRGMIARSCAESLTKDTPLDHIKIIIEDHTSDLPDPKDVGVLSVRCSKVRRKGTHEMQVELCVVHNAESMGFAYLSMNSKTAVRFLKHDSNKGSIVEYGTCTKWPQSDAQ